MGKSYKQYENACAKIREENEASLARFESWLKSQGASAATARKHRFNIDFYINEFLLYEDAVKAEDGAGAVDEFLGYWFIRKAMWASAASIKANAASLKKFYAFMLTIEKIDADTFDELNLRIKMNMPKWLKRMERYDDPEIEDPDDVWE